VEIVSGKSDPFACAERLLKERHPSALVAFVAGSIVRGEATAFSDIDLVIVYDKVAHPFRESLIFEDWPVECFIHDAATARYFFEEVDGKAGDISLPSMVLEGRMIPGESAAGLALREMAKRHVEKGPAVLGAETLVNSRYMITDLVDDLRAYRNEIELYATLGALHEALASFHFRAHGRWSASKKHISRRLLKTEPALALRWIQSFEAAYRGKVEPIIELAEVLLKPFGGFCFEGYRRDAPADWRRE
jgi:hypothetical protein